jgi:hypothetical protein
MRDFSLDLWYPYVLENKATYRMVVQDGGRGIQASRTGNTLHFALPAIALVPGTGVRLEIAHDR